MPRVTKKTPGRPARNADNRVELRRHKASTSMRIDDKTLAGFEKLARSWEMSLGAAFEHMVNLTMTSHSTKLRRDVKSPLGWS